MSTNNNLIELKVTYKEDTRRFRVARNLSFAELQQTVRSLFESALPAVPSSSSDEDEDGTSPASQSVDDLVWLKYKDEEGDLITISSQLEWDYALTFAAERRAASASSALPLLHVFVMEREVDLMDKAKRWRDHLSHKLRQQQQRYREDRRRRGCRRFGGPHPHPHPFFWAAPPQQTQKEEEAVEGEQPSQVPPPPPFVPPFFHQWWTHMNNHFQQYQPQHEEKQKEEGEEASSSASSSAQADPQPNNNDPFADFVGGFAPFLHGSRGGRRCGKGPFHRMLHHGGLSVKWSDSQKGFWGQPSFALEQANPNQTFVRRWRLCNNGLRAWPVGTVLRMEAGDVLTTSGTTHVVINPEEEVPVGDMVEVETELKAPGTEVKEGEQTFSSLWRVYTADGVRFGRPLQLNVVVKSVESNGHVEQQLKETKEDERVTGLTSPAIFAQLRPAPTSSSEQVNKEAEEKMDETKEEAKVTGLASPTIFARLRPLPTSSSEQVTNEDDQPEKKEKEEARHQAKEEQQPEMSEEDLLVQQLVEMGFQDKERNRRALQKRGGDISAAISELLHAWW
ncbi:hypothetical protein QOT17_005571 [Balamuthia mandrillaris]